jgi:hypothetical protein
MSTATEPSVTTQRDGQKAEKAMAGHQPGVNGHQLVIVDLGRRQSAKRVKRLRKGRGKLVGRVDKIVADLVAAGTLEAGVQPVVIVVREKPDLPKFF